MKDKQTETEEVLKDKNAMKAINAHKNRKGNYKSYTPLNDLRELVANRVKEHEKNRSQEIDTVKSRVYDKQTKQKCHNPARKSVLETGGTQVLTTFSAYKFELKQATLQARKEVLEEVEKMIDNLINSNKICENELQEGSEGCCHKYCCIWYINCDSLDNLKSELNKLKQEK